MRLMETDIKKSCEDKIEDYSEYIILVIEDDKGLNHLIRKKLERAGFYTEGIFTGKDAIAWSGQKKDILLLLDYRLPDVAAEEIVRRFQKESTNMSFLIITGNGDEKIAVEMMKLGAADYLVKDETFLDLLPSIVQKVVLQLKIKKELTLAQEALKKSEERLKLVLEGSNDAFWDWNIKTGEFHFSSRFSEILGYKEEEIEHSVDFWRELIHPEDSVSVMERVNKHLKERKDNYELEHRILTGEGGWKWVLMRGKVVCRGKDEIPLRAAGTYTDITGRKIMEQDKERLQAHLLQAQKMEALGVLAGGIAHDFNNILLSIIGYTELAMFYITEGSEAWQSLEGVIEASDRAKELSRQILTFSRKSEKERKPLKVSSIVKEALKFLKASLPKNIKVKENIVAKEGLVLADSTQIYQVVMNLCTNSAHAIGKENGLLKVDLCEREIDVLPDYPDLPPGAYLELTVKDTGYGIKKDVIKRIFEPFFTTKKRGEGTGMGLSVVHGIVKSHGGAITVESEPGKGSTFQVFLPRIEAEVPEKPKFQKKMLAGKERILCVDDEKQIVYLMEKILGSLGYNVDTKISSTEALETFRAFPEDYDLIITDEGMPDLKGSDMAKEIFSIRPEMPVILCTGFSDDITPEGALQLGIKKYIPKPVSIIQIAEAIRKIFD